MKRKIYDRLLKWKQESQGDSALMIEGARRVGKSSPPALQQSRHARNLHIVQRIVQPRTL